tara:strand:- start:256 stop:1281 length:1026 start_codon:yes stop_codon:yes gene_type:complete
MADEKFYNLAGPFDLNHIAQLVDAKIYEKSEPNKVIYDVAPLDKAESNDLSFLDNPKYRSAFKNTKAGACIIHPSQIKHAPKNLSLLITEDPYKSYALAAKAFYPTIRPEPYISQYAHIADNVQIGEGCRIEAGAVINSNVIIGSYCHVESNAVISAAVSIGDDCVIGANSSLSHCSIGKRVKIYPGARIGQEGFGFAPSITGHTKVPQLGKVVIHNDCEIGANTTIDRGSGPNTIVGQGTWLDNLVQIGHNAKLGRGCIMASQSGLAGSAEIGDFVFIGGQVGISGHIKIGDGVKVAGQSGVIKDIPPGLTYGGTPAVPIKEWHRQTNILASLIKSKGGK